MPEGELEKDEVWMWWPTLSDTTPNFEAIVENMLSYSVNPYICMLTVYYYGYAKALDDTMYERVWPHSQLKEERLPDWLDPLILEDLKRKFGELH